MQLGVVGSKLKRLSTWSIWPMVENSGFQAEKSYILSQHISLNVEITYHNISILTQLKLYRLKLWNMTKLLKITKIPNTKVSQLIRYSLLSPCKKVYLKSMAISQSPIFTWSRRQITPTSSTVYTAICPVDFLPITHSIYSDQWTIQDIQ